MANATLNAVQVGQFPYGIDPSIRTITYHGTLTVNQAGYNYVSGGLSCSWTNMVDVKSGAAIELETPWTNPVAVYFTSSSTGYNYVWTGTNGSGAGKLQIFNGATELTGGSALPAAVTSDVINVEVVFAKG